MGPNRHNMENYGDLQPIARSMQETLWVPSENVSFGLLPKLRSSLKVHHGPIHQALRKELNPDSGLWAKDQGLCTEMGSSWQNVDFHSRLIRTSFIRLSYSFVLDAKAGRYVQGL